MFRLFGETVEAQNQQQSENSSAEDEDDDKIQVLELTPILAGNWNSFYLIIIILVTFFSACLVLYLTLLIHQVFTNMRLLS